MTSFHLSLYGGKQPFPSIWEVFAQDGLITAHVIKFGILFPRTVSKSDKPEPVYNFRLTHSVLAFTKDGTNFPSFPKIAVSPESLVTGQT